MLKLDVNGTSYEIHSSPTTPLLWVLRDELGLTGTKYSCGAGLCGACNVLVDGQLRRSCKTPVGTLERLRITTIEGLAAKQGSPLLRAWLELDVPQCGYCQPGQLVAAHALLDAKPHPTDADIDEAMSSTLCRCGTYQRIRAAIHRAAKLTSGGAG